MTKTWVCAVGGRYQISHQRVQQNHWWLVFKALQRLQLKECGTIHDISFV